MLQPLVWGRAAIQWYLVALFGTAFLAGVALGILVLIDDSQSGWSQFGSWLEILPLLVINRLSNVWEKNRQARLRPASPASPA